MSETIINSLVVILTTILGSGGLVQFLLTQNEKKRKKNDANTLLLLALAQDRICTLCEKAIKNGEISINEKIAIEELFEPYQKAGGNHRAKLLFEEVQDLEISK